MQSCNPSIQSRTKFLPLYGINFFNFFKIFPSTFWTDQGKLEMLGTTWLKIIHTGSVFYDLMRLNKSSLTILGGKREKHFTPSPQSKTIVEVWCCGDASVLLGLKFLSNSCLIIIIIIVVIIHRGEHPFSFHPSAQRVYTNTDWTHRSLVIIFLNC